MYDCPICFSPIKSTSFAVTMECCSQLFHFICYTQHLERILSLAPQLQAAIECPCCRTPAAPIVARLNEFFSAYPPEERTLVALNCLLLSRLQRPHGTSHHPDEAEPYVSVEILSCLLQKFARLMVNRPVVPCHHELCNIHYFSSLNNPLQRSIVIKRWLRIWIAFIEQAITLAKSQHLYRTSRRNVMNAVLPTTRQAIINQLSTLLNSPDYLAVLTRLNQRAGGFITRNEFITTLAASLEVDCLTIETLLRKNELFPDFPLPLIMGAYWTQPLIPEEQAMRQAQLEPQVRQEENDFEDYLGMVIIPAILLMCCVAANINFYFVDIVNLVSDSLAKKLTLNELQNFKTSLPADISIFVVGIFLTFLTFIINHLNGIPRHRGSTCFRILSHVLFYLILLFEITYFRGVIIKLKGSTPNNQTFI